MSVLPLLPRPRTRGDCANVPRPCPFVGCRYHLFLDVGKGGVLRLNFPDKEPHELKRSCALDIAAAGGLGQKVVAKILGVSKQAVQQSEKRSIDRLDPRLRRIAAEATGGKL